MKKDKSVKFRGGACHISKTQRFRDGFGVPSNMMRAQVCTVLALDPIAVQLRSYGLSDPGSKATRINP